MKENTMNRRRFLQASALTAGVLATNPLSSFASERVELASNDASKGNRSNFKGVQVGAITYSFRAQGKSAGDMLLYSLGAGLGSVELMGDAANIFVGSPAEGEDVATWRRNALVKYKQLAAIYHAAGIDIHIIKQSPNAKWSDDLIDFNFEICKAVGAMGLTTELNLDTAKRVGPFADKHGKYLIFHNHGQPAEANFPGFDAFLAPAKNIMLNFDAGHYFGFTGKNPCDVIKEYHKRIASIHLKDKTSPTNPTAANKNMPWGQGETPLPELLQLISSNSSKADWPTHCDIELEYDIPAGSTPLDEVAKCVRFCKDVLA
ncbi:MAG: twin-arginine translocation signal domain-containing protein [Bacteroidales bacterium]|nr:twin-arginine translocation signal domain-containing protein [Bacteroidales bacterium]